MGRRLGRRYDKNKRQPKEKIARKANLNRWANALIERSKEAMRTGHCDGPSPGQIMRAEEERRRIADQLTHGPSPELRLHDGLTPSERAFARKAAQRGWKVYRGGWPDFLCIDPETEAQFLVEVKSSFDKIRESQEIMFAALELAGIHVRIFRPDVSSLVHWRVDAYGKRDRGYDRTRVLLERRLMCVSNLDLKKRKPGAGPRTSGEPAARSSGLGEDPKGEKRTQGA